jgi:hypothetical protein
MPSTIAPDSTATGANSDPELPPDLDPETHPIIATHFYGLDLREAREVREVYWNQVRLGEAR